MRTEYVTTALQAKVTRERETIEAAYERLPETMGFWAMIDLVGSANYRLTHGPLEGYVRGETFFAIVREVIAPCADVRIVKEMGDAVLLAAATLRPMLECVILVEQVASQLSAVAGSSEHPFAVRAGIGAGNCKRIIRTHEDFLGSPIDRLARLMGLRSPTSRLYIDEDAYATSSEIVDEYREIVSVSSEEMLPQSASKGMAKPIYYREILLDRQALLRNERNFAAWRKHPSNG